jgi:hypothetical protein
LKYHCAKFGELGDQILAVESDVGPKVTRKITVIGSTEYCNALIVVSKLVAFLLNFVRSDQKTCINNKLLRPLAWRNFLVMSCPKPIEAPLLLGVLPCKGEGSAQSKSHIAPFSGGSRNLKIFLISLRVILSSEGSPPWHTITYLLKT